MVAETSVQAYEKIKSKLGGKQEAVYEAIKELGTPTNEAISDYLGWPINRVTGRVTELRRFGIVEVYGLGVNKSGFSAKQWVAVDPNDKKLKDMALDCGD